MSLPIEVCPNQKRTYSDVAGNWTSWRGTITLSPDATVTYGSNFSDYKDRIRRRLTATTSLDGYEESVRASTSSLASAEWRFKSGGVWHKHVSEIRGCFAVTGTYSSGQGWTAAAMARANAQALTRVVHSIYTAQVKLQSLVCFGEMGESLRMIRSPLKSLFRGYKDYLGTVKKRTRRSKTTKVKNKVIANTWLEYTFGWAPLMNDIKQGGQALADILNKFPPREIVKGNGSVETSQPGQFVRETPNRWSFDRWYTYKTLVSVRYKGMYSVPEYTYRGNVARLGLTTGSWLPSIWELIPYSFVIDYFTNAGEIIESLTIHNLTQNWMEKGTLGQYECIGEVANFSVSSPGVGYELVGSSYDPGRPFSYKERSVNRSNYSGGSLTPPVTFEIPGLSMKWLNLAALITTSRELQSHLNK